MVQKGADMTAEEIRRREKSGPCNTSEDWIGHALWEVAAQLAEMNEHLGSQQGRFDKFLERLNYALMVDVCK
jgi:hypothetical protein